MNLRQREPRWECRALLDAVYQIPCQADWPHDCGSIEPSHSNQERHGKGKSRKAHDCFIAALCHNAHRELDQGRMFSREDKFVYWQRAHERTLLELFRRGLVGVIDALDQVAASMMASTTDLVRSARSLKPRRFSTKTGHANGASTRTPAKCRIGAGG